MAPRIEKDLERMLHTLAHGTSLGLLWRLELADLHRLVEALYPVAASPTFRPLLLALCRAANQQPHPRTLVLGELIAQREDLEQDLAITLMPERRAALERRIQALDQVTAELLVSVVN